MVQFVLVSARDMLSHHVGCHGHAPSDEYFVGWFNKAPKVPSEEKLFVYMVSSWLELLYVLF